MRHRLFLATATFGVFGALAATAHAGPVEANVQAGVPIAARVAVDPDLTLFVEALDVTGFHGLVDACNDAHTTVFAPTDRAFRAAFVNLGVSEQEAMRDGALLSDIVAYHLLPTELDETALGASTEVTTVSGLAIVVQRSGSTIELNGTTTVTAGDIGACNGMVHVIDRVLVPPASERSMPVTGPHSERVVVTMSAVIVVLGGTALVAARRPRRRVA